METRRALLVFGISGIASVLLDLDHALAMVLWYFWYPTLDEGRILHPLFLIVSSMFILCMGAYLARLYHKYILRRSR